MKFMQTFGISGEAYLPGNSELEKMINKLLELKASQVREQSLLNSDLIEFVTGVDHVKDMVNSISLQKKSVDEVAASSEEISYSIEEISQYVQTTLNRYEGSCDNLYKYYWYNQRLLSIY